MTEFQQERFGERRRHELESDEQVGAGEPTRQHERRKAQQTHGRHARVHSTLDTSPARMASAISTSPRSATSSIIAVAGDVRELRGHRRGMAPASVIEGAPDDIIELARSCDVLVHMCHYFSGTEPTALYREACGNHVDCAGIARDAGVGTLVLTHVLEQIDRPGVREQIVKEIRDIYDGNVIWGEDLMEIPIGAPRMAKME